MRANRQEVDRASRQLCRLHPSCTDTSLSHLAKAPQHLFSACSTSCMMAGVARAGKARTSVLLGLLGGQALALAAFIYAQAGAPGLQAELQGVRPAPCAAPQALP